MIVASEHQAKLRQKEIQEIATCGAVVCDQQFLANQMGVSTEQFVVG